MNETLRILLFLGGYIILMKWVLPWLGVGTCMSGGCALPPQQKRTIAAKAEEPAPGAAPAPGER